MGKPKRNNVGADNKKGGTFFQPERIKGNIKFFNHLNEISINNLSKKVNLSESMNIEK